MHGILELSGEAPIKKFGNFESKTYQKKHNLKRSVTSEDSLSDVKNKGAICCFFCKKI